MKQAKAKLAKQQKRRKAMNEALGSIVARAMRRPDVLGVAFLKTPGEDCLVEDMGSLGNVGTLGPVSLAIVRRVIVRAKS